MFPGCEGTDKPSKLPGLFQGREKPTGGTAGVPGGSREHTQSKSPHTVGIQPPGLSFALPADTCELEMEQHSQCKIMKAQQVGDKRLEMPWPLTVCTGTV